MTVFRIIETLLEVEDTTCQGRRTECAHSALKVVFWFLVAILFSLAIGQLQ